LLYFVRFLNNVAVDSLVCRCERFSDPWEDVA